jgi:hypothetical protein
MRKPKIIRPTVNPRQIALAQGIPGGPAESSANRARFTAQIWKRLLEVSSIRLRFAAHVRTALFSVGRETPFGHGGIVY